MSSRAEVRTLCAATIAVACVLAGAGSAEAVVRCVPDNSPGGCQVAPYATITAAEAAAIDGDTIKLKGQEFPESVTTVKRLNFIGAGAGPLSNCADPAPGATVIKPAAGHPLTLKRGGSVVGMRLQGGPGAGFGLNVPTDIAAMGPLTYTIRDVCAAGGPDPFNPGVGAKFTSSPATTLSITDSTFEGPEPDNPEVGRGLAIGGLNTTATLTRVTATGLSGGANQLTATQSTFEGPTGVDHAGGSLTLRRSRVFGRMAGISQRAGNLTIEDSLVRALGSDIFPGVGLVMNVVNADPPSGGTAVVRGSTIWATSDVAPTPPIPGFPAGGIVVNRQSEASPPATVSLRNSIVRFAGSPDDPPGKDLVVQFGTITASSSSFNSAGFLPPPPFGPPPPTGGTFPAPGSGSNVTGKPGFVNEAARDLRLAANSPLIDRGDPAFVTAGELDLAGLARSLPSTCGGGARPDIGAFERQVVCPPAAPPGNAAPRVSRFVIAKKRLKRRKGTKFSFTLSEAAKVAITIERKTTGRRVRGRCRKQTRSNRKARRCTLYVRAGILRANTKAGRGSITFSGRFKRRALALGSYRARLVATDSQGAKSAERRLSFKVVKR